LEAYPKSKYGERHFWLENVISPEEYEDAILEYDEVIKKYAKAIRFPMPLPAGNGLLEMKDTTNARLILKEVVAAFLNPTKPTGRKKLKELGYPFLVTGCSLLVPLLAIVSNRSFIMAINQQRGTRNEIMAREESSLPWYGEGKVLSPPLGVNPLREIRPRSASFGLLRQRR